jgi:hypothetical protein
MYSSGLWRSKGFRADGCSSAASPQACRIRHRCTKGKAVGRSKFPRSLDVFGPVK